jgi:peroxiredoxin
MNEALAPTLGLTWLVIGTACWFGWQLLRQNGRMLLRVEALEKRLDELKIGGGEEPAGLPLDSPAPDFDLTDLAGQGHTLAQYRGQPLLLVFFNPACGFCRELAPKLATLFLPSPSRAKNDEETLTEPKPRLLVISTGDLEQNRKFFNENQITGVVLLQKEMEVATAYQASGTPTGYLISPEGKIASDLAVGAEAVLALQTGQSKIKNHNSKIDQAPAVDGDPRASRFSNRSLARSKIKRDGLKAGTPAPEFRLPRLDGHGDLALSDFRGRPILLVFSSPHCGPCNTLVPKLEKFHRKHPDLQLVMISRGEPGEKHAKAEEHRLTFPVVLQQQWEVSRQYAMFATPVAYLIDPDCIIAADVAVGSHAILDLMRRSKEVFRQQPQSVLA